MSCTLVAEHLVSEMDGIGFIPSILGWSGIIGHFLTCQLSHLFRAASIGFSFVEGLQFLKIEAFQ